MQSLVIRRTAAHLLCGGLAYVLDVVDKNHITRLQDFQGCGNVRKAPLRQSIDDGELLLLQHCGHGIDCTVDGSGRTRLVFPCRIHPIVIIHGRDVSVFIYIVRKVLGTDGTHRDLVGGFLIGVKEHPFALVQCIHCNAHHGRGLATPGACANV